jgi:CHAT domain-containing protein
MAVCVLAVAIQPCPATKVSLTKSINFGRTSSDQVQFSTFEDIPASPLRLSEPVQRGITGGETQVLKVALLKGQYAQVAFEWRGMDLDVEVRRPGESGKKPATLHVRGAGSLPVTLIANADGDYSLTVRPTENATITGNYGVVLEAVRPPTPADQKRIEALSLIIAADREQLRDAAIQKLQQALQLWTEIEDRHGMAQTLRLLGQKHLPASAPATSNSGGTVLTTGDEYYRRSIEIAQGGTPSQLAYTFLDIGSDYETFVSPTKALGYYQQALKIFQDTGNRLGEATASFSLGLAEARIGDFSDHKALRWYEPALAISRAESDRLLEARTLNGIGGVHGRLGDQAQALSYYQQAELILKELNDTRRVAITTKNIGVVYDDWGDLQTAKDKYLESLSVHKLQLTTKDLDSCKGQIAGVDKSLCNSIANTLDNVAELYSTLGESQLALSTLRDALSIREILQQPRGIGATLSRIAYAHLLQNEPTKALEYCGRALPYSEGAKDLSKVGSILTFLGMSKAALNQPDEALEYYRQALALQEKTGELRGKGITFDQMGRAYALKQDLGRAAESYERALAIWRQIKDQEWEPRSIYNLARVQQERGDLASAQSQVEKAIQMVESRRGALINLQLRTSYFANKEDIYKLDVDLKMQLAERTGNDALLGAALETSDKARARTLVDTLSMARLTRGIADASNARLDPAVVKLEARKQVVQGLINVAGNRQIQLLGDHKQAQAEAINKQINELTSEYDSLAAQTAALNPRYAELTRPTPLTTGEIQQQLDDQTLMLEYSLGDKRSYAWVVSRTSIHGFKLTGRDEIEAAARRVTEALTQRNRELKGESFAQKQSRLDQADRNYPDAVAALSKLVLDPVAAKLGRKRLVVVADGALQTIPFTALPLPPNSAVAQSTVPQPQSSRTNGLEIGPRLLINEYEIVTIPSASALAVQSRELTNRKAAPLTVAVIADPVFDNQDERVARAIGNGSRDRKASTKTDTEHGPQPKQNVMGAPATSVATDQHSALATALRDIGIDSDGKLRRLPFSLKEAKSILRTAPGAGSFSALDFKASRATAMSAELSKYRIIHFATHGLMNLEHPELSGIVLSMVDEKGQSVNGYLRLHEIYNLNLPAELVVLSACETGVGKQVKGEGLIAVTRGFMYAGSRSVMASLWKVEDSATSALMEEFYLQMFTNQLKPAAALRAAQSEIAKQKRWQSPYFWAGFFLQGDWR